MFLTYLFTIIMGLIFGVLNMKSAENYWIDEMWHYAKKKETEAIEAEKAEAERIAAEQKRLAAE